MLVESVVTLARDNRNNSTAFQASLRLCENLGKVLDNAEGLLQEVRMRMYVHMFLRACVDSALILFFILPVVFRTMTFSCCAP